MIYNRGNDFAADDYAERLSDDQALDAAIEARVAQLMDDHVWVSSEIDTLIATAEPNSDGVCPYAADLAELIVTGADPRGTIDRLRRIVKAVAYEQAESEIDSDNAAAKLQEWLGDDEP